VTLIVLSLIALVIAAVIDRPNRALDLLRLAWLLVLLCACACMLPQWGLDATVRLLIRGLLPLGFLVLAFMLILGHPARGHLAPLAIGASAVCAAANLFVPSLYSRIVFSLLLAAYGLFFLYFR
jgi:hypothetical protein